MTRTSASHLAAGLWALFFGTPVLFLALELVCVISFRHERQLAQTFLERNANPFAAATVREAAGRSLWKKRWLEYRPGARLERSLSGEHYTVVINSHGFRTHEFMTRKPKGTLRVLCIGGSTTVQGRTNDETYPAILERSLKEALAPQAVEVLNLGISAAFSDHWLDRADQLFSFEPDLLLEYDAVNDIMWRALPHFARTHALTTRLYRSLLLQRLLPIDTRELDGDFADIIGNQVRLGQLCRQHHALHLAGSFAAPAYDVATRTQQAYLDTNFSQWTHYEGSLPLNRYRDYTRILSRYDQLFVAAAAQGRLGGVMIHRELSDPSLFLDICHMKQEGIARLAESFLGPARRALEGRVSEGPSTPLASTNPREPSVLAEGRQE